MVSIPDAGFRACIAEELAVAPSSPLTQGQLAGITYLDCMSPATIGNLSGWEHLVNVVDLYVDGQNLTGALTVPSALTKLEALSLADNQVTSLMLPSTLTALTYLDADQNRLAGLAVPASLTNVQFLYLNGNQLTGVTLPTTLTSLLDVSLSRNALTSFTVHSTWTNLMGLELSFNQLTSLPLPATLTSLEYLGLAVNQLTSLTVPATLTSLVALEAHDNLLGSLVVPSTLTGLEYLELTWNQLTSVSLPNTLTGLQYVGLANNRLTDLSALTWLPAPIVEATGQRIILPNAQVGVPFSFRIRDQRGQGVTVHPTPGVAVSSSTLTYSAPGDYTLDFSGPNPFNGTITQKALAGVPATVGVFGDHTGDGVGDLFAIDKDGQLRFHQGSTTAQATDLGVRGTGWGSMTYLTQIDDITGDKRSDLLARRGTDQSLWVYRSLGGGSVTGWKQMGKNWGGMDQIVPAGNLAGGATQYVVARRAVDGALFRYTLTPNGLTGIKQIGQNWNGMRQILSVGDFNGDGRSDILAIRNDGTLWSYLGTVTGGIGSGKQVGQGWGNFVRAFTAGDLSGDKVRDLVGQRADGAVFTYANRRGSWGAARLILTGTQTHQLMA